MSRLPNAVRDISNMIDRLVLGLPPHKELTRRMQRLAEAGWWHEEIADEYGMTRNAVSQRLARAARGSSND